MTAPGAAGDAEMDTVARLGAVLDPPPRVLGVPDSPPDPNPDRDTSPRPDDGPQDVAQNAAGWR